MTSFYLLFYFGSFVVCFDSILFFFFFLVKPFWALISARSIGRRFCIPRGSGLSYRTSMEIVRKEVESAVIC